MGMLVVMFEWCVLGSVFGFLMCLIWCICCLCSLGSVLFMVRFGLVLVCVMVFMRCSFLNVLWV